MGLEILKTIFADPISYGVIGSVIVALLWCVKLFVFKKFDFIEVLALTGALTAFCIIPTDHIAFQVAFAVFFCLFAGYAIYTFIVSYRIYSSYDKEMNEFLKNNEFDFFVQTNARNKITNFSNKLLKITKLPRYEIKGVNCWKLLFEYLKVEKINGKDINVSVIQDFIDKFKSANSRHVIYQFEFEMPKLEHLTKEDDDESKDLNTVKYTGLIQPVFYQKKLIGRNIYFYQDRIQVLTDLRMALKQATLDLNTSYNFMYVMMSLMDYVGLYFDYNTRTYVATEAFMKYTRTHQREYTFNQFLDMMHPDDVDAYVEQAATINSLSVTKIKYRLLINDEYYYVMEDSININKDADLASVIRILNKTDEALSREVPLSTHEAESLIDKLSTSDIMSVINKTENILNTVVGEDEED